MISNNPLCKSLAIEFPLIMAPMFLVSNVAMMKSGIKNGIMATFPTLNYRNEGELEKVLEELNAYKASGNYKGNYGVNLIVQKTNPLYVKHLAICVKYKVPFFITSLGSPAEVIKEARTYGAKVYCDVTNITHAQKAFDVGCDGFIAVGQGAGGHAGPNPLQILIPSLIKHFPNSNVVGAGGVVDGQGLLSLLALGAVGASVGTRFIATKEAGVNDAYKNAIVEFGMDDVVLTTKISGTPANIISTPYAQSIGFEQNFLEKFLSNNPRTKKWFKMLVQIRGMKKLQDSVGAGNYKTLWCVGKTIELIDKIESCEEIIERFKIELNAEKKKLDELLS